MKKDIITCQDILDLAYNNNLDLPIVEIHTADHNQTLYNYRIIAKSKDKISLATGKGKRIKTFEMKDIYRVILSQDGQDIEYRNFICEKELGMSWWELQNLLASSNDATRISRCPAKPHIIDTIICNNKHIRAVKTYNTPTAVIIDDIYCLVMPTSKTSTRWHKGLLNLFGNSFYNPLCKIC